MNVVKRQLKQMYLLLGLSYIFGCIIYVIWQPSALFSFTFGTLVSALNFYLTYISFAKLYQQAIEPRNVLLVGPLPKLVTIIIGTFICYQFSAIFSVVSFLVGVCLYPMVYLGMGTMDYVASKK